MKKNNLPAYECSFLLSSDFWNLPLRLVSLVVFQIRLGNGQESFPIPRTVNIHQQGYLPTFPHCAALFCQGRILQGSSEPGRGCWWADQISATRMYIPVDHNNYTRGCIEIWYYGTAIGNIRGLELTYTCMSHKNNISLAGMHIHFAQLKLKRELHISGPLGFWHPHIHGQSQIMVSHKYHIG